MSKPRSGGKNRTVSHLAHLDNKGRSRMVDVGLKPATQRTAKARARIVFPKGMLAKISKDGVPKGAIYEPARIAGILGAKKTPELIPLCHSLALNHVGIQFRASGLDVLEIICEASTEAKTGVEMEALTGAAVAALTVYDMCKSLDKGIRISEIVLLEKVGGKSGHYRLRE